MSRRPAYLIATDTALSPQQIVQHDVWRWDIEANFRDPKTLLGLGQAQLRHPRSVEAVPQLPVAAYAGLLLAARQALRTGRLSRRAAAAPVAGQALATPPSTQDLIQQLRAELWGEGLPRFRGFPSTIQRHQKPQKLRCSLPTAVLYAAG